MITGCQANTHRYVLFLTLALGLISTYTVSKMNTQLTYDEWVQAAAAGETAAWTRLYRKFYPGMYVVALRICNDSELATDAVQDAFVTAYLKLSQLKDPANFGGWLRQIVTHISYRSVARSNKNVHIESLSVENEAYWEDEVSRKLDQQSTQSRLYSAMSKLPDGLHSTLLLRYFSSFQAYEQIAAILAVPVGTVRSRLNQAKLKLEAEWKKHEDATDKDFVDSEEWNAFYQSLYGGMHAQDTCKNKFLKHIQHSRVMFTNGKKYSGGGILEHMVDEDRQVGSWLKPVTVFSSGRLSIIEAAHFNSSEYPNHCPQRSVAIIQREKDRASQVFFHPLAK